MDERVSTLELFFDLVFVFTVTQLTTFLVRHPTGTGVAQVAVLFANLWWMFGGYAWLTNSVPPRTTSQQLLILVAMASYLVIALATPDAFATTGVVFGVGYLIVTIVHLGLFLESTDASTVRAMRRLGPNNLITAGLVLAGGFPHGAARWILWTTAAVLHWATPLVSRPTGIGLRPAHFVERHGLILLIAIGESVVAVGIGLRGTNLSSGLLITSILALAVAATLWWMFFDGEDERAERALRAAPVHERAWLSLYAFGYLFLLVIPGIVLFAAGVKLAVVAPTDRLAAAPAWFLAAGVAVYVGGLGLIRAVLATGRIWGRAILAGSVMVTPVFGLLLSGEGQLAALAAILIGGLAVERVGGQPASAK